mmetsp:Transcript_19410/g.35047  ORF Transcript_19410/g.35047 Transcript_19410/m.35047 type:complete len:83 (+) Transcript_19410:54-302(+)
MFLKRILDHLLNQMLVESLANSRTFQRFAVWSHGAYKELSEKAKDGSLDEHFESAIKNAKANADRMRSDFQSEIRKQRESQR